ncbi:hypothetical protein [Thermaerobacter litoralis]
MAKFFRIIVKALRQQRYDRLTPEEVLSSSERALLREVILVLLGMSAVGGMLALLWMAQSIGLH